MKMKRKMYGLTFILFKESESLSIGLNTNLWTIGGPNYYFICEEALPVRQSLYLLSKWRGRLYVFEGTCIFLLCMLWRRFKNKLVSSHHHSKSNKKKT